MQKEITPAGDIITAAIEKYNSTVSDIYKMKFNYTELSIFVDAMEQYANKKLAALQTMTAEQIKGEAKRLYPMESSFDTNSHTLDLRAAYIAGASAHGKGEEIFPGFWSRLLLFVENIQVNDAMSEEEKEIIINCAKAQHALNI